MSFMVLELRLWHNWPEENLELKTFLIPKFHLNLVTFQRQRVLFPEVEIHRHKRQHELPSGGGETLQKSREEPLEESAAKENSSGIQEVGQQYAYRSIIQS